MAEPPSRGCSPPLLVCAAIKSTMSGRWREHERSPAQGCRMLLHLASPGAMLEVNGRMVVHQAPPPVPIDFSRGQSLHEMEHASHPCAMSTGWAHFRTLLLDEEGSEYLMAVRRTNTVHVQPGRRGHIFYMQLCERDWGRWISIESGRGLLLYI